MADETLKRDANRVTVLGAITNDVAQEVRMLRIDPATGRLIVSAVVAGTNNGQLKVSAADTTYGYLEDKLVAGSNITLTVLNVGGNEQIQIDATGGGGGGSVGISQFAYGNDVDGTLTSDANHTLLADGTLILSSTFGDMTGNFYQGIEPTLGGAGIWGSSFSNNTTGSYGYDIFVDGTNSADIGNDSAKILIIEFPNTSSFYQGAIIANGIARSFFTPTSNFEEQSGELDYKLKINDGTSGGVLWGTPQGMGVLSSDLSSGSLGYPVLAYFGQVFADDTGTSTRVATGKAIADYVQTGTFNSTPVFTGTGLDDFSLTGDYTGSFTGTYTVTCIGNDGARVVFSGGMTTGTQFDVGETVTGSISGETARVSQGTSDTRIWAYDVSGTGFVLGDILTGSNGNVSTAVTTISPSGGDLMEINYSDLENTSVQWFTGTQSPFSGIGGINFIFGAGTGHTPNDSWSFTATALYEKRYDANSTNVSIGDTHNDSTGTGIFIDVAGETITLVADVNVEINDTGGNGWVRVYPTIQQVGIGDLSSAFHGVKFIADDLNYVFTTDNGIIRGNSFHDNSNVAQGSAAEQDVRSGTYTPTLTGVTNVTATTARKCQWMRVGNVVTVSGQMDIDPAGVGLTVVGISLPVASDFGTAYEAGGTGHVPALAGHGAAIYADATNDRAELSYVDSIGSNDTMTFTFTYEVI